MADQITAGRYDFPAVNSGDTYEGATITMTDANGDPIDLSSAAIRIAWRRGSNTGPVAKSISVGSGITVTDGANGEFQIDAFDVALGAGTYYHDWHFVIAGKSQTLIKGRQEITRDVTP